MRIVFQNRLMESFIYACLRVGIDEVPLRMADFEHMKAVWKTVKSNTV